MTTTAETDTETSSNCQTKEWIEKAVSDTFNELLISISSKTKLHPTEQVNRDSAMTEFSNMKIYDFINSYHAYCKLCEQHFYSRSVPSDINSFFQKHINTSYHRQIRATFPPSDTTPIITWEDKFQSGRCNLCEMDNINPYILDTEFDVRKLIKFHVCFWDQENRETNERVLRKFNSLKKYCGLKIFREKYIKTINGRGVCLMCRSKLPWSGEKAYCHLSSDSHYQNFCEVLRLYFSFLPKDVLNGYNLETVTRWVIIRDLPIASEYTDFDERDACLKYSNGDENPYSEERGNFSFSLKDVKLLENEEMDFIHKNECLVCNKAVDPKHMSSALHLSKAAVTDKTYFDAPEKFVIFCRNREKRLRMIKKYKTLKNGLTNEKLENPPVSKAPKAEVKRPSQPSPKDNYLKTLLKKKIDLISFIFTVSKSGVVFCEICDQYISFAGEILHLTSSYHKSQEAKWNELKAYSADERFTEPFLKVKNIILCLVCGAMLDRNCFFSHLKGGTHLRGFEWYCNQKYTTPISSSFLIKGDFSCICTQCSAPMNKRASFSSLKTTLEKIRSHWPCLNKTDKKTDLTKELKIIFETNKTVVEKNLNLVQEMSVPCSTCGRPFKQTEMEVHSKACAKDLVDFEKVEKTLENVVDVFEKNIMYNVLDRSVFLLSSLNTFKMPATTKETKKILGTEVPPIEDPLLKPSVEEQTTVKKVDENSIKLLTREKTVNKNNINMKTMQPVKNAEKECLEEEHEVLVIEGLPNSKRRYDLLYGKLSPLGKIRYVFFNKKSAIVAFAEPGTAELVTKTPSLFQEQGLSFSISTRKEQLLAVEKILQKPPLLNQDLVPLLQDPQILMDFSLNLIVQAISASESPLDRKQEEVVCNTIINAVLESYPESRCYPFGSRLSGLTLNNSDLDVFLDCGGMYDGFKNTTPSSERKLVNKVAGLLRKKREITQIIVVDRARVPIVSFLHKPTLMRCDLSFKNGLSVQNTLLIKFMISLDWRVRPLILFLKHWVNKNGLHGPPFFSSYAVAMLVIYFLEQLECPVLPTIESLKSSYIGRRMTIGGWDCNINLNRSTIPQSQNNEPFPKLLAEFFEFYSKFDYQANVISPLTGKPLPRKVFSSSDVEKLPMSYKRHILNIPVPIENLVNNKICICIVDPFDLSHVLTKSFTSRGLQMFIQLCKSSAEILNETVTISELENLKTA